MAKFEVTIIMREQINYVVDAEDADAAEEKARAMWANDDDPVTLGNEWADIEKVTVAKAV